jgi:hypothetical protein
MSGAPPNCATSVRVALARRGSMSMEPAAVYFGVICMTKPSTRTKTTTATPIASRARWASTPVIMRMSKPGAFGGAGGGGLCPAGSGSIGTSREIGIRLFIGEEPYATDRWT